MSGDPISELMTDAISFWNELRFARGLKLVLKSPYLS